MTSPAPSTSTVDSLPSASMSDAPPSPPPKKRRSAAPATAGVAEAAAEEEMPEAVWEALSRRFGEVQTLLDQNRVLIAQVNENHQSKLPENLTKNVALIRDINLNISKIVAHYGDMSVDFLSQFHRPHRRGNAKKVSSRLPSRPRNNSKSNEM